MTPIRSVIAVSVILATSCGQPVQPPAMQPLAADDAEYTRGRLIVADGPSGKLTVLDLDDRTTPGTLMLDNPGLVYASPTSEAGLVYATQRMQNRTSILSVGTEFEPHEGHYHVKKVAPSLRPQALSGAMPTHWTFNEGWVTLFNDGDGTADFISEAQIARGELTPRRASTGLAHHGVALVHGQQLVASMGKTEVQNLADGGTMMRTLAAGATERAMSTADVAVGTFEMCPSLHGEFTTGKTIAFGCTDGALILTWNGSKFEPTKVANPSGRMGRVGTVEGHAKLPVFIGNFDLAPAAGMALIDARNGGRMVVKDLPTRRFAFKVDERGQWVVVLTMDGQLHRFKVSAAGDDLIADGAPLRIFAAYEMWPASGPRPAMAMGWDAAYVSDPRDGMVHEISLTKWAIEHSFMVGGQPASLALSGLSPDWEAKKPGTAEKQ
jgi:hypothetical protein